MPRDDVLRSAWRNDRFRDLPATARALFSELVILGSTSSAGVLPLMPAKWAMGCRDATELSVMADLSALSTAGFVIVDIAKFEVMIRNFIRDSGVWRNPNHFRGALNSAQAADSPVLRQCLALELRKIGGPLVLEAVEMLTADSHFEGIGDATSMHLAGIEDASEEAR